MKLLISFFIIISSLISSDNPKLTVQIQNIEKVQGKIVVGIFNTDKDFLKEGVAIKTYTINVDKTTETLIITDLPKGDYAISLYHDENSDDECNRNFLGIPKEGYGFSNNIKPKFSAPTYQDCKFSLMKDVTQSIKLIN